MDQKQLLEAVSLWFTTKGRNNKQLILISSQTPKNTLLSNLPNFLKEEEEKKKKKKKKK